MRKIYFLSLIFMLLAIAVGCGRTDTKQKSKRGPDPGYYEQYRVMKQNEVGEIPFGLRTLWQNWDKKLHKTGSNLFNIREWGPNHVGGRTRAILIDKSDSMHLIAGAISGGIWNSYDRGKTWKQSDDHALTLAVTSLTQNPFSPNEIYFGTGESMGNSAGIDGNGVFKSLDGGQTFTQLSATSNANFTQIWTVRHSRVLDSTIYVGTHSKGLWRSTNGGNTFTKIYNTSYAIHDIEVFADGTLIFTVAGYGLYRLDESTTGINKIEGGLPTSGFNRISVAYCESNPKHIYAQFANSSCTDLLGIYRSTNGGINWTLKTDPGTNVSYSWAWYCMDLAVHLENPEWVAAISVTPGYSTDGGNTWKAIQNTHADYHTMVFFKGENKCLIGNDGGIYLYNTGSMNTGAINLNIGYNVTQFYAGAFYPGGTNILGGTQDNGTFSAFNGNAIFNDILGGDGSYCGVNQQDSSLIYASTQNGDIRRSTNFGSSWTTIDGAIQASGDDLWFINPFELNPKDGHQVYFPTKSRIYRTTDRGTTWTAMTNKILGSIYAIGMTPENNPTLYFGGQSSMLYRVNEAKTAVAGSEFMMTALAPSAARGAFIGNIEINPLDHTIIYLSMNNISANPRLWKVLNANTNQPTWVNISGDLPAQLPVNWVEVDSKDTNFIAAATDFGLYTTRNGGQNWVKEMSVPNVQIPMIRLRETDGKLFIFTHGRGVFEAETRFVAGVSVPGAEDLDLSIYPNPASDQVHVHSTISVQKLELFDLQGKRLKTELGTTMKIRDLPNGLYIMVVNLANGDKATRKVLVKR